MSTSSLSAAAKRDRFQTLVPSNLDALPLTPSDEAAILSLPHVIRSLRASEFIVQEDDRPTHCCLLLSGYAIRHKVAGNGGRQIFSIHMKGDVVDLNNSILRRADHNVQALTAVEVAMIPVAAIREIITAYLQVGKRCGMKPW